MSESQSWEEFFRRVTYKPGFTFFYNHDIDRDWRWVIMEMRVPNSRVESQAVSTVMGTTELRHPLITVTMRLRLEPWFNENLAKVWLRQALRKLEDHELDEWFKYDGEMVNDPHLNDMRP